MPPDLTGQHLFNLQAAEVSKIKQRMETNEWTQIDLFSGANAFRLGFEAAGFNIVNHLYSEIDKHAIANTRFNYPNSQYIGNVTDVSGLRPQGRTFITFGWPCQDNSIAGKRKGHAAGTRSGLLFEAVRLIDEVRPEFFTAENVEGLRTVNKGIDIVEAVKFLAFLNESLPQYDVEMQLLNTRWFLPQNRERLYFVGHLRNGSSRQVFPIGEEHELSATQRMGANTCISALTATDHKGPSKQRPNLVIPVSQEPLQIKSATVSGFELASEGDSINLTFPESKTRRGRVGKGVAQTLDTSCNQGVIAGTWRTHNDGQGFRESKNGCCPTIPARAREDGSGQPVIQENQTHIRRLTPTECEKLQGWPENHTLYGNYDGIVKQISDTQRYRLCGNGVSEPCVRAVAQKLHALYHQQAQSTAA